MAGDHCIKKGFFFSALSSLSLWSWDVWGLSHLCSLSRRHFDERGGPVYYSSTRQQDTKAGTDDLNHQLNCLFFFLMQFSETQDDISKFLFFFKQSKMIKCPILLNWIMQQIVTFKKPFAEEISWTVKQISKLFVTYHLYWSVCEAKSISAGMCISLCLCIYMCGWKRMWGKRSVPRGALLWQWSPSLSALWLGRAALTFPSLWIWFP